MHSLLHYCQNFPIPLFWQLIDHIMFQATGESDESIANKWKWHINVKPTTEEEAYCGKGSFRHQYDVFRVDHKDLVDLREYPYACFAYKGSAFQVTLFSAPNN